jgi:hypothetical protein
MREARLSLDAVASVLGGPCIFFVRVGRFPPFSVWSQADLSLPTEQWVLLAGVGFSRFQLKEAFLLSQFRDFDPNFAAISRRRHRLSRSWIWHRNYQRYVSVRQWEATSEL